MSTNKAAHHEDAKKTAGNISSAFFIRAARYPFLILFIVLIPRMLGASEYGKYALVVSILMLTAEVCTFGITIVFGRYIPELLIKNEKEKLERLLSFYFLLWLVCCCLLAVAGVILYFTASIQDREPLAFLIIYLALISEIFSLIVFSLLYGLNYVGKSNASNLFRSIFRLAFLLVLYPIWGFYGALVSLLLTPLLSILYAVYSIKKVIKLKFRKPSIKEFLPQLKFGIIIFTPSLLFLFQQQIGPTLLKIFSFSNKEIGYFDLANQGFLVLYGLAVTSFEALIPISSKFEITGQKEKGVDWLFMLVRYILPILLIIISGFYLFGDAAINLILGKQYISIYAIALIILLSIPVWLTGQLGYVRSVSLSRAKPYFRSTIFSTLIFIIFGAFFVKTWGAIGLAVTAIISASTFSVSILLSYKELISRLVTILSKILLSAVSFSLIFIFSSQNIGIEIIIFLFSSAIFLAILSKLKVINAYELKQLFTALRKTPEKGMTLS